MNLGIAQQEWVGGLAILRAIVPRSEVAFRYINGFVRLDPPQIRDVVQKSAERLPESRWGQYRLVDSVVDAEATGSFRVE
jgi:hypothetical protein